VRILFVLAFVLGSVATAGPSDAEAEAAAQRVYAGGDYQVVLPTDQPRIERERPRARTERERRWEPSDSSIEPPDVSGASLARFLWYLLLAVVVAGLLLWAGREFMEVRQRNLRAPQVVAPAAAVPAAPPPVPDHVKLAAAGRHAEAIHSLLLASLREVHRRAGSLAPAWTSREILYKVALPDDARAALEEIVRAVELSRFGGLPAGEAEYAACLLRAEACRAALPEKAA